MTMSNKIRDGLRPLLATFMHLTCLISNENFVNKEPPCLLGELPNLRPFDVSVLFDHILGGELSWHCPLMCLGFDVTVVQSAPYFSTS